MTIAEQLRKLGHNVEEHVLCVDRVLWIFLPAGKWRDLRTGESGKIDLDTLVYFVEKRLEGMNHEKALPHL